MNHGIKKNRDDGGRGGIEREVLSNKYRKGIHLHIMMLNLILSPYCHVFPRAAPICAAGRPASDQEVVLISQQ